MTHTDDERKPHTDQTASINVDVDGARSPMLDVNVDVTTCERRAEPALSPPGAGDHPDRANSWDTRSEFSEKNKAPNRTPPTPTGEPESGTTCPENSTPTGLNLGEPDPQVGFTVPRSAHPKQQRKIPTRYIQRSSDNPNAPLKFFKTPAPSGADLRRPPDPTDNRKPNRRPKAEVQAEREAKHKAQREAQLALIPSADQIPNVSEQIDPALAWERVRDIYRNDPINFVIEILGVQPDPWQIELLEYVNADERRLSVCSGHNVGKTAVASWIVLWHFITRYPQKTIITSPAASQLEMVLIPELKKWMYTLPPELLGLFEIKSSRIELKSAPHNSFIQARTASKDSPESMQGIHCEDGSVLLVVDEASGVPDNVYAAAEGSMAGPNAHMLLISNPTRLSGFFYQTQHDWSDRAPKPMSTAWRTLHISSLDARCRRDNADFATGISDKYGIESNEYRMRVLGLFPDTESNLLIHPDLIDSALARDIQIDPSAPLIYGVDVGRLGNDRTVLVKRRGSVVVDVQSWAKKDTAESAALIYHQAQLDSPDEICVDSIGMGVGVSDSLRALGLGMVRDVNVAEAASVNPGCNKLRDDLWWQLREWLGTRSVRLFNDDSLIEDLRMPTYSYTAEKQRIVVQSKDLMRKVLGRSPDYGDALCLTFGGTGAVLSGRSSGWSGSKGPLRRRLWGVV